jgi:hypothetical protein
LFQTSDERLDHPGKIAGYRFNGLSRDLPVKKTPEPAPSSQMTPENCWSSENYNCPNEGA